MKLVILSNLSTMLLVVAIIPKFIALWFEIFLVWLYAYWDLKKALKCISTSHILQVRELHVARESMVWPLLI